MQFTTNTNVTPCQRSCLLWCKDTNFNAIHNYNLAVMWSVFAVYYGAKILILMQFTTDVDHFICSFSCLLWCKDTNFNAIHNKDSRGN